MGGFEGNHFSIEYPNAHSEPKGFASWKLGYFSSEDWQEQKIYLTFINKNPKNMLDGADEVTDFFEQFFLSQMGNDKNGPYFQFLPVFYGSHWLFINCQMAKQTKLTTHTRIYKRKMKGERERNGEKMALPFPQIVTILRDIPVR